MRRFDWHEFPIAVQVRVMGAKVGNFVGHAPS